MDAITISPAEALANLELESCGAIARRRRFVFPFPYSVVSHFLPTRLATDIAALELESSERRPFGLSTVLGRPALSAAVDLMQSESVIRALADITETDLEDTYLRMVLVSAPADAEFGPRTEHREAKLTIFCSLAEDAAGLDLYLDPLTHVTRAPFGFNTAVLLVPDANRWFGFERRPDGQPRRWLEISYVTEAFPAKDELAFPMRPLCFKATEASNSSA